VIEIVHLSLDIVHWIADFGGCVHRVTRLSVNDRSKWGRL
jgi:hypothetical protein